jgi:hypothetical protein
MSADRRLEATDSWTREPSPSAIRHASPEGESFEFVASTDHDTKCVGSFHYAALIRSRPRVLTTWRVSSDEPSVLDRIAELLGGASHGFEGNTLSLITGATTVEIALIRSADAVRLRWCRDSRHTCDGRIQGGGHACQPCVCPLSLAERRRVTRQGRGCEPRVAVVFRLLEAPALGNFAFASGSWRFAEDAARAVDALRASRWPVRAQLHLHRAPYTLATGQVISCTTPRLTVLGPVDRQAVLM